VRGRDAGNGLKDAHGQIFMTMAIMKENLGVFFAEEALLFCG
jgi:hypothetical protein